LAIWISSFEKVLFGSLAHFFIGSLILYIFYIWLLAVYPESLLGVKESRKKRLFCNAKAKNDYYDLYILLTII
jgi:hypothetical protein